VDGVTLATLVVAAATFLLALATFRLGNRASEETRAQWRPIVLVRARRYTGDEKIRVAIRARTLRIVRAPLLATLAVACLLPSNVACSGNEDGEKTEPVDIEAVARSSPHFDVPYYETRGSYPKFASRRFDVGAVNGTLEAAVRAEQRRCARVATLRLSSIPKSVAHMYPGVFSTSFNRALISGSSVVASALIPVRESLPGGTAFGTWTSATARVPTGASIALDELFARPEQGLSVLSRMVRTALGRNQCVRESWRRAPPGLAAEYALALSAVGRNYRHFALLPGERLAIGFTQEEVASPVCYRVLAVVPVDDLRPYLSDEGAALVMSAHRPKFR
jgi:hypothetical protein